MCHLPFPVRGYPSLPTPSLPLSAHQPCLGRVRGSWCRANGEERQEGNAMGREVQGVQVGTASGGGAQEAVV